ncbi:MAG: Eco29kI family restriction endonuclease [Candidatus Thiodiazotropha sp. (ex Dulcina madagascariensis)]|nr:Eco29kI family restriction endonuclease [Candidatus Thiodiazotropha sp. (ex Dulcina madagascariensis)]MCU7927636.1 Eco29kI family restriction endonuclease [Candidatus Thiodiazotropha sp. (ex Dulcina madagascariensis)]
MNRLDIKVSIRELITQFKGLVDSIPDSIEDPASLTDRSRKTLRAELLDIISKLESFAGDLDPIHPPDEVFDPSDPAVVGRLIARTLLERPRIPLGNIDRFYGSGVYAIYYMGPFDAYEEISGSQIPIYVGKVDPASSEATTPEQQGDKLWNRLVKDHAKNVDKAENLDLANFEARFLVVRSAWQNTAENYLINWFKPVWNNEMKICYGFGKHGDRSSTRDNTKSPWDTLHPGRAWAADAKTHPKSVDDIKADIRAHYATHLESIRVALA